MIRKEFEDPVEQVMFILGFKHDPRFRTSLEAMIAGSNSGILDAADQVGVYGAIHANFCAFGTLLKELGPGISPSLRKGVYETIVKEMDEKSYGGKWFPTAEGPPQHWVNLGPYSPIFRRRRWLRTEVFCLPAPYFNLLSEVFK